MGYTAQGVDVRGTLTAAAKVVEDPYLPKVTSLVLRLNEIEKSSGAPGAPTRGIGLKYAVTPLELFVKYRERPWLTYAIATGVLGTVFLAGFLVGKPKKGGR